MVKDSVGRDNTTLRIDEDGFETQRYAEVGATVAKNPFAFLCEFFCAPLRLDFLLQP
jgi:hypothetical protein